MQRVVTALVACILAGVVSGQAPCHEDIVQSANLRPDDCFGLAFDVCGDLMVVGAPTRDEGQPNGGAAYVFERIGGQWVEVQQLLSGDPVTPGPSMYGSEVATDGEHIFVQSQSHSAVVVPPGGSTVSVYEKQGGSWVRMQRLYDDQNVTGSGDNFGFDIELDGGRAYIVNILRRTVHVFEKMVGAWTEIDRIAEDSLPPFSISGSAAFAYHIDVEGDRLAITHHGFTSTAHILEHDGLEWRAVAELRTTIPLLFFDAPITLQGDEVFVGGRLLNAQSGSVWVFGKTASTWAHTQTLFATDSAPFSDFGSWMSIDGDRLAIGAPDVDFVFQNAGAVYLFERQGGGQWQEAEKITANTPTDKARLGQVCKLQGDRLHAGGPGDHVSYGGALHEFRLSRPIGVPFGAPTANSSGAPAAVFAVGSAVVEHNCLTLEVIDLPPGQFGYFLMSLSQGFVPLFGGSQGILHLALPIVRFSSDIVLSGPSGEAAFTPDLTSLPQMTAFQPGDTWSFQMWFRDVNPGPTSNTSNGLAVTFETNGDPAVQFPAVLLWIEEEATLFDIAISLSQETDQDVVIPYTTGGTAAYNTDWRVEEPNPIVIPAGETSYEMTIIVAEDTDQEGDETGVVTLGTPTGGILGTAPEFTLTIVDDD